MAQNIFERVQQDTENGIVPQLKVQREETLRVVRDTNWGSCLDNGSPSQARLTQLGECFPYKEEVIGSSPISSISGDPPPYRDSAAALRKT